MTDTVENRLKLEARVCPLCRCEITNPFISRCPRCLTHVPIKEVGCSSCAHRLSCPAIPENTITSQ